MLRVIRKSSLLNYSTALVACCVMLLFLWPGLMQNLLKTGSEGMPFMRHEECYQFIGPLVWMHFSSDLMIWLSYVSISLTLSYLVYRARRDIPFHWVFLAFGLFIIACGFTHFMEVITTFGPPRYWLAGYVKLLTAVASVATAVVLPPLVPRTLALVRAAKLSEQRRAELEDANRELEMLYGRVKELDELKTQFFANVSHELRTPLALILGPAQKLLASAELDEAQRRALATVERNARTLLKHVNDLLDISKLEAGKMRLDYTEVDLAELARMISAYFESFALERSIDFVLDAPPSLRAEADAEKLQRVLVNLLSNAFKFTPDGGRVRLALHADGERASFDVSDSGPGVPAEMREIIFERFRQAGGGDARRFGGTGLGLAIAKEFAELHGGEIGIADAPEGGARFSVRLPLRAPAGANPARPLPNLAERLREQAGPAVSAVETERRQSIAPQRGDAEQHGARVSSPAGIASSDADEKLRAESASASDSTAKDAGETAGEKSRLTRLTLAPLILVVEDNLEMNRFIAETVGGSCRVESAFSGSEGIERAIRLRPDLIISDVMMPGMAGEEFLHELRAHEDLRDVPVLMLSAKADDELRVRLLRAGAQDYLVKPFVADELRARAANLVELKLTRELLQRELESQSRDLRELAGEVSLRRREMERAMQALRESNRKLEAIIAASPLAIITLDAEGRVESWSAAAERIFGWKELEVLGGPLPTVPEELREEVARNHAEAVRGKVFSNFEARRRRRDGTFIDVSISTAPLINSEGRARGVLAIVGDITERKRTQAALRRSEERYRHLFESNLIGIITSDFAGNVLESNDAFLRLIGYTREELSAGRVRWIELTPLEYRPLDERGIEQCKREGSCAPYEKEYVRKDGSRVPVLIGYTLLPGVQDRAICFVLDLTGRRRAEEALRVSETRFRTLVEQSPFSTQIFSPDGRTVQVNRAWERLWGVTLADLPDYNILADEQLAERGILPFIEKAFAGEATAIPPVPYVPDRGEFEGQTRWVQAFIYPVKDDGKDAVREVVLIHEDITERRLAEQALETQAVTLREQAEAIDQAYDAIIVHEFEAGIRLWNQGAEQTYGFTKEEALGRSPHELLRTEFPVPLEQIRSLLAEGHYWEGELTHTRKDGKRVIVESRWVPVRDAGGSLTAAALEINRDVTGRKAAEAERERLLASEREARREAEQANRAKDEFLATLSHELRTPLTPIIGWVHLLGSEQAGAAELKHGLAVIDKNSQALSRLINDLLDMSAILKGKMRIDRLPVQIEAVLQQAVETVRPQAERRDVRIEFASCTAAGEDTLTVLGDRTRLVQVFWNLLTNAVKFSHDGGRVRLLCAREEGAAVVRVEDEGIGVEPSFLPYVFDRFRQADMSTTKVYGGLGIGLALVRSFVEAHGGTVAAESVGPGRGSRFTVRLPLEGNGGQGLGVGARGLGSGEDQAMTMQPAAGETKPGASGSNFQPSSPTPRFRVLVIEDAPDTLEMLRLFFELRGDSVALCATAEEALHIASRQHFDIIVSDIGLPQIDGYELLRRLRRERPHLAGIPALALTGYASEKNVEEAREAGFAAHLAKPFEPAALAAAVDGLLARCGEKSAPQTREE